MTSRTLPSQSGRMSSPPSSTSAVARSASQAQDGQKLVTEEATFEDAISDIALATSLVVLPMLALSAVFFGLVFCWRITLSATDSNSIPFSLSRRLVNNTESMNAAFFVDIESTRLVTIASWTSTVVSFLPPWIMVLFSYPLARRFLQSRSGTLEHPTPYQLSMIIELFTAGYGSIWNWLRYRAVPSKKSRGNKLVALTVSVLLTCTTLGVLIVLADTWLHLTTTTVILQETSPSTQSLSDFSRAYKNSCTWVNETHIDAGGACLGPFFVTVNVSSETQTNAYRTLYDLSNETRVVSSTSEGKSISYFAAATIPGNVTYRASTVAMSTTCTPITRACKHSMKVSSPQDRSNPAWQENIILTYNCTRSLGETALLGPNSSRVFDNANYGSGFGSYSISYYNDPDLIVWDTVHEIYNVSRIHIDTAQLAYFTVGTAISVDASVLVDPNIDTVVVDGSPVSAVFILSCSSSIQDMEYSYSNGEVADVVLTPASNETISAITLPIIVTPPLLRNLLTSLRQAGLQRNMDDLTKSFATSYSKLILSMGSGAIFPAKSLKESSRTTRQITRMPMAPFFTLIVLNCLYALMGITLAIIALAQKPKVIKPVQARLSVTGLIAAMFEGERAETRVTSLDQLFEEKSAVGAKNSCRVSLVPTTQGGLRFESG